MTIENELLSIQNLQQEYADFENNPETKFMSPELVDEIKKEFENRLQIYQQRIRRKQNISDTVNFANESSEEAYKAKRQQERAEMNPVERGLNAVADYSAKTIPLAGELASNIALGGGGFLARSAGNLTGWKGLETIGEKTMQANRDFKNWLDIENSFPSYFEGNTDHEWNSVEGASQNVIGGVGKFMEGYHEFAPLGLATSGVGAGIGMAGKALGAGEKAVKAAQTAANLGLFASSNVANTSDYIEQTSGKFKPIQSGVSSAVSALAMEIAFALGRGRGMNDVEASNYATRMLTENQFAMMGKKAFKQSLTTAIANGLLNGGIGTWIREEFALPDNPTQEDYDRLASNVWEAIKHETAQGAIWGGFGAIQYHNEVRKLFNQLGGKKTITTPDGKKRSVYKINASAKFISENSEKLQKEKFPNLFETGSIEEVNSYLDELFKSVPEKLILGKSAEFGEQKENFKAALLREYNLAYTQFNSNSRFAPKIRNAKENKEAQTVNSLMANKVKGLYSQYVAAKKAMKNIDIEIEASKEDLQKQQELARQKEELQLKSYALTTQLEKPYSVYDMVGFIRNALEKQYGQMPEFMKRVDDVLSKYMSDNWHTPISADEAMGVYQQIAAELSKLDTRNGIYKDYNSDIEDIISPKLIEKDNIVYGNDETPQSVITNQRQQPIQIGYDSNIPLEDNRPSSVIADNRIVNPELEAPQQPLMLDYNDKASRPKMDMPRENMNISQPRESLPINDKISGKSTSESPSSFKESTSSLNIPQAVKSTKPVEQPNEMGNIKPIRQNKIDSTGKVGNKAVRDSESFDTRADMPQSVMTDRTESPAIKNERGKMGLDVEMKQKEAVASKTELKYTERDMKFKRLMNLMQHRGIVEDITKKELEELAERAGFKNAYEILNSDIGDDIMPFVKISAKRLKSGKKSEKDFWVTYNKKSEQQIKNERAEYQAEQARKESAEYKAELAKKYPILNDIGTNTKLWNAIENTKSKELQDILLSENAKRFEQARSSGNLEKWIEERKAFDNAKQSTTEKSSAVDNIIRGKKTKMTTKANGGMEVDGQFGVVDVNDLQTATSIGETQNRNRETISSQAQINSIGNNPNPEYLIVNNPDSTNGAMVITSDGKVLSGNGRTLGLKTAYESGNAEKYKAYLREHAKEFGINPKDVDKIKNPVLVRIIDPKDGFDVKRFVKESNESQQLGRNAAEIATTDAENIKDILRFYAGTEKLNSEANSEFIRKFFEKTVGDTERGNYLSEDGSLTPDGEKRVKNALLTVLYGKNTRLIGKLTNTTNEGIKNISKALMGSVTDGSKLKGEIAKGKYWDIDLGKDISDAVITFMDTVEAMHKQKVKGSEINFYLKNMKDRLTPEGKAILGILSEFKDSPKKLSTFLQQINDVIREQGNPQQADIFTGKPEKPSNAKIIKEVLQKFDSEFGTKYAKKKLNEWNISDRSLFDDLSVNEDGIPASVKREGFTPDYSKRRRSEWTKKDWEDFDNEQYRIANKILGEENTDTTPIKNDSDIKLSKQQQTKQKVLKEFLPDIFEKYDRESESPASVQALQNILRGGEALADIEYAINRGDPREAINIIRNIKERAELTYSKEFSAKIAKNCDRLIKMIKNSNYRDKAIKPISLEELEAQPINRMPQEDVEGWREQREAYVRDKKLTELSKLSKRAYAGDAKEIADWYKSGKITDEQKKLWNKVIKAEYDYNLDVDFNSLTKEQKDTFLRAYDNFWNKVTDLNRKVENNEITFEQFVNNRHELAIDYHTSLEKSGIKTNGVRRMIIDPNRNKPQLSRTKNKATNPVSDKDLNNFLRGQAKQITKETGLNFKVVNSVDELRKMFPNNDITDTVEGGIHKDTVYLVRGNINKDRLPLVIAHEVAGHRGVEALFENKQQMDAFFNSLERASAKDKFIREAFAEVDRLGYKENRSREAMAKIVEKVRNESGTLKGTAKTFVNFITSRVRRLLRRMGFKNLQLNEAEVYDIAVQALRRTGLKNSNKFFGLDRFLAKDNSFLSATSTELDQKYPGWSNRQTTSTGRHSTQAAITEKTYKKIGDWILNSNLKNSKILDASSGMGLGTEALRKMGLNVDDIEPYPGDRKIKPTYSGEDYLDYTEVYKKHGKTYDLIISNAVLNVIPDDWRKAQLHAMADVLLNKGGKLIINVRGDKEVANTKNKIILDSPNEILLPNSNGGYRAYQKGFSQKEFQDWVSKELGAGYKVEKLTPKNSGLSSSTTGVIVTKEGGNNKNNTVPKADIQFSIGGKKAKTADIAKLEEAKKRLKDGEDKKKVWAETGWYIAKDGKPRFEISDKDFSIKPDFAEGIGYAEYPLYKVINHKKLFEAYPELKGIQVEVYPENGLGDRGSYDPRTKKMRIKIPNLNGNYNANEVKKAFMHEIQHAVQGIEGFAIGTSAEEQADKVKSEAYYKAHRLKREMEKDVRGKAEHFEEIYGNFLNAKEAKEFQENDKYMGIPFEKWERGLNTSEKELLEALSGKELDLNSKEYEAEKARFKDTINALKEGVDSVYDEFFGDEEGGRRYKKYYGEGEARMVANRLDYYDKYGKEIADSARGAYDGYPEKESRLDFDYDPEKSIVDFDPYSYSESRKKSPIEDVAGKRKVKPNLTDELAQKIIDEVGEVKNPKDYNAVKKIAKENMAEYKDLFSTKKNTGYKTAALKLHHLIGYKMKTREVEKNFRAIKDFNVLKKTAGAYIRNNIADKSSQANLLDKIVKANSFEKVYDIITNTNIAKEKELRQNTINDFVENMKNLKAKKVSSATYEAVQDIIDKNFTKEELDGLLNTNEFTTKAVSKLRDLADGIASGLGNISKTDVEVAQWAIDNARKLKKGLNNLIQKREEGNTSLNIPVEKLAEVNTLLNRLYQQEKEARKALDTSLENVAVADKQKILAEAPEAKNPDSRATYSLGTVKENITPVTAANSLDNDNIMSKMGKTMHKVAYENLLEGQNKQDHYRAEGYKVVDDIYQSFGKNGDLRDGMNNLNETAMQVKTSKGHTYDITKGEVLAAVATYMDSETRQIIDRAGGVDFFLEAKRDSDYFTFTTEELKKMTDSLTPLEKKALKKGSKLLSQVFLPAINETHERLNGVPLRIREDGIYFPRFHVNLDESIGNGIINRDSAPYLHQQMNADYQAMLKQRNSKARPSLMLKSFPEVLNSYVDQGALYIGMAEPLRHLNRVMTEGMKRELISRYGKEYVDRITTLTKNMAGMAGRTDADRGLSNRFLSNIAAAKLTPVSAVKQFSSVPLASSIIDFKYLAKAALSGLSNENINEMMKLDSMILRYRNNGIAGIIPLNTKTWEGERQLQKHSNKWYNKIVDTGLNLSVEADKRALGIIYKATKLMAEAKGKGNDKAWIEKTFMDAVRRTQNTTDLASANGWQMKSRESAYWSFLNMYQNQTQKIGNEAVRLFRGMKEAEKQYGKESAQYKEAKGKAVDFAIGVAIMNAMSIGIGAGASAILHKKDEKETARQKVADFATDTIFNLTGNPILKPVMGGSSYVLRKSLPKTLGGSAQRTQSEMFGNDFTNLVPDTIYTAGKIFEEINSDDPVAKKFRKVTAEALRSKSFENGLAMGRVPTWFLRYPSQLYRKYAVDESKSSKNSTSLFKKRPQKKTKWKF